MTNGHVPGSMWLGTNQGSVCQVQLCSSVISQQHKAKPSIGVLTRLGCCHDAAAVQSGRPNHSPFPAKSPHPHAVADSIVPFGKAPGSCHADVDGASQQLCTGCPHPAEPAHSSFSSTAGRSKAVHGQQQGWSSNTGPAKLQQSELISAFSNIASNQRMPLPTLQHPGDNLVHVQSFSDSALSQPVQLAHSGPVHAIVTMSDRVVTLGGACSATVMREWTLEGELIATHTPCKQGSSLTEKMSNGVLRQLWVLGCLLAAATGRD